MTSIRAAILSPETPETVHWLPDALITIDDKGSFSSVTTYAGEVVDHDMRGSVLLPGFFDTHIHYPQTRIIGSASGPLLEWLDKTTFPEEARFADPAYASLIAKEFCQHLLRAGTTSSFIYGSVHASAAHVLFEELLQSGLRAIAGPVLMDAECPPELVVPVPEAMANLEELMELWHNRAGRLQVAVIPRFALSCSMEMMNAGADLARSHGLWVSTHLAENPDECAAARSLFGTKDYLKVYEDAGLVHEKSLFAHCIYLSESERNRFAEAQAIVSHCPDSNLFLGSGGMPIQKLMDAGIPITMGTDVAGGRSFRIPHALSRAYDNALSTGSRLSLPHLLWLGTRGAALALKQPHLGQISAGCAADFIRVPMEPWVDTAEDVFARLLFYAESKEIEETWIGGTCVWSGSNPR